METRHTKQFETHEVPRILVNMTPSARSLIAASGREGNKFPLALSEVFGVADQHVIIKLDGVKRSDHHVADNEQQRLLHIQIFSEKDLCLYQIFIADHALWHEPNGIRGFDAVLSAKEILKLYLHVRGGDGA